MFWYLTKKEDRPRAFLFKVQEKVDSGELEKLPKEERDKLIEQAIAWEQAQGRNLYDPSEKLYEWFLAPHWIKGIRGGNQCLAGESEIYDPVKGKYRRLDQIDEDFHVLSWAEKPYHLDVENELIVAEAEKPFLKGHDDLYEIELSNGNHFTGTLNHQILSTQGYISVDHAWKHQVSVFSPLLTISERDPSTHLEGGHRLSNIISNFLSDCLLYPCLYGAQPPSMSTIFRDAGTLLDGALKHIFYPASASLGGQEHKREYSHSYLRFFPRSSQDASDRNGAQFFESVYNNAYIPSELASLVYLQLRQALHRFLPQSISEYVFQPQSNDESYQPANQSLFLQAKEPPIFIQKVRLVSPSKQPFYDFHVPHFNNYYHEGIIHHNSGKSAGCIIDFVMQMEGWHPLQKKNMERIIEETFDKRIIKWLTGLYKRKYFFKDPPLKMRCVAVDYPFVERVVGPEYVKWLTQEMIDDVGYANEKKRKITVINGSFVEFLTQDQPTVTHGGAPRDAIQHDEEPPSDIWDQSKMRVATTNGRLTLGMTAEKGVTWTESEIWKPGLTHKDQFVYAAEISTYDNPINTQAMVDKIKTSCRNDQAVIDIRIYGKSTPRGGNVYPMAKDIEPWIISPFQIPEKGGYLIRAIDPHGKLPHAVLWIWVDYEGINHPLFMGKPYLYEVAELFEPCNIPELASFIRDKETYELGRKADFELCDPYAWNTDQNNPQTIADQMIDAGLMVSQATKDRDPGIVKVQEMLSLTLGKELPEDKEKAVVLRRNYPQIMTFDTLSVLREERKKYRWKRHRQRFTEDSAVIQKPVDKDDHMMENEYRIALFVIAGDFDIIEMPSEDFDFPGQKQPVIIGGNKMDVDFSEEKPLIEDAYLG